MTRLRVLLVEDSATVRGHLRAVLEGSGEFEVIGEAGDGSKAIELCTALRPDVITMDMVLPGLGGLGATEHIMAHCPTPIVVVSSSFNRGELVQTVEALAAGAVDVLDKPRADDESGAWEARLLSVLRVAARVRVITHPRARLPFRGSTTAAGARSARSPSVDRPRPARPAPIDLVALAASTGGPAAVATLLRALPASFAPPILLVLHIGEAFAPTFAEWLGREVGRPVRFPVEGEPLTTATGSVLFAPPNRHMLVERGRVRLEATPERNFCRPSADVLFESLAAGASAGVGAVILTGMGRDGATGLLALRRGGALTIAQDEDTSVVYGMPREAASIGAAELILPLDSIAPALVAAAEPARQRS